MGVEAESADGKFGHIGGAHDDGTGSPEAGDDGGVPFRRRRVPSHRRAGIGRDSGHVAQILDRYRNARQGRRHDVRGPRPVACFGGGERRIAKHPDGGCRALASNVLDPREGLFRERAARRRTRRKGFGDTPLPFHRPAARRQSATVAFDGGPMETPSLGGRGCRRWGGSATVSTLRGSRVGSPGQRDNPCSNSREEQENVR